MEKGTSQSFEVILLVPDLIDQKSYNLSASSKGYDVKELAYNALWFSIPDGITEAELFFHQQSCQGPHISAGLLDCKDYSG